MKTLQEMKLLVRMKRHLKEDVPQELLDQIAIEEARLAAEEQKKLAIQEERRAAFKSTFSDLSKEISKLVAEEKQKTAEEQALLDRFANVLTRIDEIKAAQPTEQIIPEIVEEQPEEVVEEVTPQPEVIEEKAAILAPVEEPTLAKEAAKKIKKKDQPPSMFVQPEPEVTSRDLKEIQRKLQLMEGWVSKISMSGPGGGAVWLRDLDDVARSSVLSATDGQVLTYNESIKKWTAQDPASGSGGSGYVLPTASTTTKGGVKVDGTTITINNQVISANIPSQVQADWTQTNPSAVDFIKNKPVVLNGANGANGAAGANGVGISTTTINGSGNLVITYTNTAVVDVGQVVGATGANGTNGTNGANGISITSANVNINGYLIITYSNTATANAGYVVGPAGANGTPADLSAYQTTAGLSANVATLTANNTLYLGGIAANQYISTTADWVLDEVGIAFPNGAGIQTVPFVGDADLLGGIAADQYAYANAIPSIAGLQTTTGLSANVAKLSANNTLFLGGIAANQYAYANAVPSIAGLQTTAGLSANVITLTSNNTNFVGAVSAANVVSNAQLSSNLANYQTTAGLSANVITLTANNANFLGTRAANQYAYANGSNFSLNNSISITYAGATPTGYALTLAASNTQGGAGYADFLKVTNTTAGATANSKSFRLTNGGGIEIVNSGYTATILGLSDTGDFSVAGRIQVNGKTAVNGPAFSAYAAAILQTIPSDAQTKVLFQTEEFDTANCYASSRFTPNVEGYYQLNAEVRLDGTSGTGEMMIILYKNGTEYKRGTNQSGTQIAANFWAMQVSSVVYANGSSDYFEIYIQQGSGGSRTVTAVNNSAITWFNGCMLRGA